MDRPDVRQLSDEYMHSAVNSLAIRCSLAFQPFPLYCKPSTMTQHRDDYHHSIRIPMDVNDGSHHDAGSSEQGSEYRDSCIG